MTDTRPQEALFDLLRKLLVLPPSEQRAILAKLDKAERTDVRSMIRNLKTSGEHRPVAQMVAFRLERADYSLPLKRHLRRLLMGTVKSGNALTPAAQAWLECHVMSAPASCQTGVEEKGHVLAAGVLPFPGPVSGSGEHKAVSGGS